MLSKIYRPQNLKDVVGQAHLVGEKGVITKMIKADKLLSMIIYGEAGCGKTTIARIIVNEISADSMELNASQSNKKDLEKAIALAKLSENFVLIIDEIHRLNKDKQDILLPVVESGLITLIGLTNSNPYHSLNSALRSRVLLLEVKKIEDHDMRDFLNRIIEETNLKDYVQKDELIDFIIRISNKDLRYALNQLELLTIVYEEDMNLEDLIKYLNSNVRYDKNTSNYYDVISSLQKSIRGSDVNAALFYLAILIKSEDLDIIERRVLVCAYEDISLADPQVVDRVYNAMQVARMVGFPEAKIPLAFAVVNLCLASKSNQAYQAINKAINIVETRNYEFLDYLRATPMDYHAKQSYYDIPYKQKHLIQYLPNEIKNEKFYQPIGKSEYEKHLKQLNDYLNSIERSNDLKQLAKKLKITKD